MSDLTTAPALWYASRATGLVGLLLLSVTVALGILTRGRPLPFGWSKATWSAIHRNVSLLGTVLIVVHIATAVMDAYVALDLRDVVVPFGAQYAPVATALGAVAVDLSLAVLITSAVRSRLTWSTWRIVHLLAYGVWVAALLHTVLVGPDTSRGIGLVMVAVTAGLLAGALGLRGLPSWPRRARPNSAPPTRTPTPAAAVRGPVVLPPPRPEDRVGAAGVP